MSPAARLLRGDTPLWPLLLVLVAVALRLLLWDTQPFVSVDGVAHIRMAQQLAGEPGISSVHQWGYPVLVALAHLAVPDWVTAARVIALVSGVFLVAVTWWTATPLVSRPWLRAIPAAAMALHPLPVRYSLTTMTESTYLVLFLAMFGWYLRGRYVLAGVFGGLAYAVRPEALLGVAFLALLCGRKWKDAGRVVAGAALVVVPYVLVQGVTLDTWTLSGKTTNLAAANWQAAEERVGETVVSGAGARLRDYGVETARAYPGRLLEVGTELLRQAGWWNVALGVAGLLGAGVVLGGGLLQFAFLPLAFIGARPRYLFPSLPFLWLGAASLADRTTRGSLRAAIAVALVAGLAVSCWGQRHLYRLHEDGYFPELVRAGEWLGSVATRETLVLDRKPYTAFYAGASLRYVPTGSYDEVLDQVIREQGDYLVVSNYVARIWRPELLPLVENPLAVRREQRLAPVYHALSERGFRTIIYRVNRPGGPPPFPNEARMREAIAGTLTGP